MRNPNKEQSAAIYGIAVFFLAAISDILLYNNVFGYQHPKKPISEAAMGNYTGGVTKNFTVSPLTLTITAATVEPKTYDGTTTATVTGVTLSSDVDSMKLIENGEVETLIVKDLSRLGREYLQVGYYTEIYFSQKGERFIVVNDGVDSLNSETNDFTPMRNWFNELYARDSSKKVRVVKRVQAERGELLGGRPPYGYKWDETVRKGIIPDEETMEVVKRIFSLCAGGKGPNQIARLLTKEQALTPSNYYYRKTGASHAKLDTTRPYNWCGSMSTR